MAKEDISLTPSRREDEGRTIILIIGAKFLGFNWTTMCRFDALTFKNEDNPEEQWARLEELREKGGIIMLPDLYSRSVVKWLIDPYLDKNSRLQETGLKRIETKEHGVFWVFLRARTYDDVINED